MRRPRHLSADERALWDMVARRAKPLTGHKVAKPGVRRHETPSRPQLPAAPAAPPIFPFRVGQGTPTAQGNDLAPTLTARLDTAPVQMDSKAFGRLKRGKLVPEARLDLHGMTVSEAHPELIAFILSAQARGLRLVLVITGKGKEKDDGGPIPVRHGVLRHQVPHWLEAAPLRQAVLQLTPAHLRHGGHGAYYVYLRRGR